MWFSDHGAGNRQGKIALVAEQFFHPPTAFGHPGTSQATSSHHPDFASQSIRTFTVQILT